MCQLKFILKLYIYAVVQKKMSITCWLQMCIEQIYRYAKDIHARVKISKWPCQKIYPWLFSDFDENCKKNLWLLQLFPDYSKVDSLSSFPMFSSFSRLYKPCSKWNKLKTRKNFYFKCD